jgi:long-chain fatty acid transport protein
MPKRTLIIALMAILILPALVWANGLNLNGLGTRAQSMGGAFGGLADDFSAVFWNPAGAAGFKQPTFGFYAVDLIPKATYRLEYEVSIPEIDPIAIDAKTQVSHYLGFLGAYYKPIGPKVVVGLGISTPSGFGTMWDGADFIGLTNGTTFDWSSKVGVFSISPLVAVKLSEGLSVGATLNINHGTFSLKRPGGYADLGEGTVDLGQYEENMNGWGFGATFGIMAKPIDKLSLGLTVRTPSTISFEGSARLSYLPLYDLPGTSDLERKITWPLWIAGGVSFRPVDRLLLSADVHWTQWSKLDRITADYLDPFWADLFLEGGIESSSLSLFWKDTLQVCLGAEFSLNPTMALRAGYTHDPAPGPDSTLNVLLPTTTFNAFSAGVGKTIGDLQLDFGIEYLAGKDRVLHPLWEGGETFGMNIVVPSVSVQYRF